MKIFIMAVEEAVYIPRIYNDVFKQRHKDFVGVTSVSPITPKSSLIKFIKNQISIFGYRVFLIFLIRALLFSVVDKINLLRGAGNLYSIKSLAKRYNIPIYTTRDINDPTYINTLKKIRIDVLVSSQPQIMKKDILRIPKVCINTHSALLPYYRGVFPMFWALLKGEKKVGVSIHYMVEKIDAGDIICQESFDVESKDTFDSLYKKASKLTAKLLIKALYMLDTGDVTSLKQGGEGSYYSFPRKEDIKRFKLLGKRFI